MNSKEYVLSISREPKDARGDGIPSICSANSYVHEAVLELAREHDLPVLIEVTSNQVNQNGGYTGLTPRDFVQYIRELSREFQLPASAVMLGGDHLGPNPWKERSPDEAMQEASVLMSHFASAGYTKLHIDASMPLGEELESGTFSLDGVARRQAQLCKTAETAVRRSEGSQDPIYVIGSEVPIPGGATDVEDGITVTDVRDFEHTVTSVHEAFAEHGLSGTWPRVRAVVVQPGVEFGHHGVHPYRPEAAADLVAAMRKRNEMPFEGHSTDYQTEGALRHMATDGVVFLKVGPELTFAMREALFALEHIEIAMYHDDSERLSQLQQTVDRVMLEQPHYWQSYYRGSSAEQRLARAYSLSDRIRYYWGFPAVKKAVQRLFSNLNGRQLPRGLVSQYFSHLSPDVPVSQTRLTAESLVRLHIQRVLRRYYRACGFSC